MLNPISHRIFEQGASGPLFGSAPPPPPPPARWTLIAFFLGFLLGVFVASSF